MQLSKFVTIEQATASITAAKNKIDNTPNAEQLEAMKYIATNIYDRLCNHFGEENLKINSFFRSAHLNQQIGGTPTSQHCKGEAIDIDGKNGVTNAQIYRYIKDNLPYDQLIWEFGNNTNPDWVHVSLKSFLNRHQALKTNKNYKGQTIYIPTK